MGYYLEALAANPKEAERMAVQSGFVLDEALSTAYAHARFTGVNSVGPHITRRLSDTVMRASLLTAHTKAARYASRMEQLSYLAATRNTVFDEHPLRGVFETHGITAADWDAFRSAVQPYSPRKGVEQLRPIDLLNQNVKGGQELFDKFQGMIWEESRRMIISASKESGTFLRNILKPDSLPGALLYSFSMFKSFPVSLVLTFGRMSQTMSTKGKIGLIAGLGASLTLAGALGVQMRELSNGRDPLAMDDEKFWGKAILAGGALSVFGDFLFASTNEYGAGGAEVAAGPPVVFAGDAIRTGAAEGEWLTYMLGLSDERPKREPGFALSDFASKNTPGSSIWWAKLALQREFFDRLKDLADPGAAARQATRRERFRQREFKQDYFSRPGSSINEMRPPDLEAVFDGNG